MLTVMLLDDDPRVRECSAETQRALGHVLIEASCAEQAAVLLQAMLFDVLVVDFGLPGMSGDVLAAEARLLQPDIGIVFATGALLPCPSPRDDTGPVLLCKPYDTHALASAMDAARPAAPLAPHQCAAASG